MVETEAVVAVVREAADQAMAAFATVGKGLRHWEKHPGNPVSETDVALDAFLHRRLLELDPGIGWLSEERIDDDVRLSRNRIWLVDPIDGTRDFVRGRSGWAISVALVDDGEPVLGVLAAPARGEWWAARRGEGAFLNGRRLAASTRDRFDGARVPTDQLPRVDSDLVMVEKPNSIALRMAMVADDRADLVATLRWGFEWDIAAAALIAQEAGATVTDALGGPLRFNKRRANAFGVLCCAPAIQRAALQRLGDRARALAAQET